MNRLRDTIRRHKAGEPVGVTSVCSAHPLVLVAAVRQALEDDSFLLVEATSNQVDQYGGYTGMTPPDFRDFVQQLASGEGLPDGRLLLGGDHLGPNRWQREPADEAMDRAEALVTAYSRAGYTKIHLDCSMALGGDTLPLPDEVVAARAARLLAAAEAAAPDPEAVSYVIGSEVPVPGGAHEELAALTPTAPEAAAATLRAHRTAFAAVGLEDVWPRIAALVVQPAVEFDHVRVIDYERAGTAALRHVLDDEPDMLFEAHSTDYQLPERLAELVEDHWAVLKVGPGLTFALREGLFALAHIEEHLVAAENRSALLAVIEERMRAAPAFWAGYYEGDEHEQRLARRFSYSDRVRYYWPDPEIQSAENRLFENLERSKIPLPLLSQYLPNQYLRVRRGEIAAAPRDLVIDAVQDVLRIYSSACRSRAASR